MKETSYSPSSTAKLAKIKTGNCFLTKEKLRIFQVVFFIHYSRLHIGTSKEEENYNKYRLPLLSQGRNNRTFQMEHIRQQKQNDEAIYFISLGW